ncbi:MAG: efflux RND transporter permease subunit [Proteobacteria bacterium]|nr:efflux RND transporter permease subunit [Pseudomonadota bacterium]
MNLVSISIKRPVFAWILMSALIIFGAITFTKLGVSQLPDVDFPVLSVSINYEGASPEVVEFEVLDKVEAALLSVEGVQEMRSSARQGSGNVTLDFDINRNIDIALQEVQTALSQVRLPIAVDAPVVRKRNPEESPIMFMSLSTDKPLRETLTFAEDFLIDQFRFIPGIGEVDINGFSVRNLRIWPDVAKLKTADLTIVDILEAIGSQHLESAAGQFSDSKKEYRVRWLGEASSPEEFGNIRIIRRGGQVIQDRKFTLKDVALVEDGLSDIRRLAQVDGKPAITFAVRKQRGSNEVALSEAIRAQVEKLKPNLPKGYDLRVNVDFTESTKAVVDTTIHKLIGAAVVTIIVCFLFLGSFQAAINILFSIPTSIVGTFIIIYFCGFTLNLFSLLALTLAVSIVVDDAIMILENIIRHHRMGKAPAKASYDGCMEILPAASAATLAVVAVFMPVVFMSGITGKFFVQFGITMSAAVLLSLVEAITITPMRSALILRAAPKTSKFELTLEHGFKRVAEIYQKSLAWSLNYSKTLLVISILIFCASLLLIQSVKREFVPAQDQNLILLSGQTPTGTALEATYTKAMEIQEVIKKNPYVKRYFVSVGAGWASAGANGITMPLYLKPREERDKNHTQIMAELRKELGVIKGVRISLRDNSARGLTSGRQDPISFNIRGPDLEVLEKSAKEIQDRLIKEKFAADLDTDFKRGLPEFLITPDRTLMAQKGVPIDSVARTLTAAVAGVRQSQLTHDGRRYDIRIKLPEDNVRTPQDIEKIEVRNSFGLRVPLSELIQHKTTETFQGISRINRQRAISIYGNLAPGMDQGKVIEASERISREVLPEGYQVAVEGSAAGLAESFKSAYLALGMGVLVAYMILAIQFNSFVHPISILAALPFSLTGALIVLWAAGSSLNLFSFIGLVVLMGIAKKNSILLVEFTNHVRKLGESHVDKALIEACPVRLRPILMTSVATVAAAMPLVIGNSIGQETRTPMGLVIIGGTIVSTVFTLYVVPCLYKLLSWFESKHQDELV